jgi:hypothetical protein
MVKAACLYSVQNFSISGNTTSVAVGGCVWHLACWRISLAIAEFTPNTCPSACSKACRASARRSVLAVRGRRKKRRRPPFDACYATRRGKGRAAAAGGRKPILVGARLRARACTLPRPRTRLCVAHPPQDSSVPLDSHCNGRRLR